MKESGVHDKSAAATLDGIRAGAGNLALNVRQRLREIERCMDQGNFGEAFAACSAVVDKLGHLAAAEDILGSLANASVVLASEATPGMEVAEAGNITKVGGCSNCQNPQCENVTLEFEGGSVAVLTPDTELTVMRSEE